ncbi:MAG: thioredoxin family protein [Verrucomicrobiia bacterium]
MHQDLFQSAKAAMPQPAADHSVTAVWERKSGVFLLDLAAPADVEIVDFFPQPPEAVVLRSTRILEAGSGVGRFEVGYQAAPEEMSGLAGLVIARVNGQRLGLALEAPASESSPGETALPPGPPAPSGGIENLAASASGYTTIGTADVTGLFQAILWGILGGLILNLMPCVLPAISLKVVGFIQQAGESRQRVLQHGLAFCAGIFVWFLGLAGLVIALRLVGQELQWAFQFSEPWAVFAMGAVLVAFALNLFGVFEIQLPSRAGVSLSRASSHTGLLGSFFHGVFATILATPCMAPFLGTTLGFALAQPALVVIAVFSAIAFGMTFPYLLLAIQPAWLGLLPKPGDWMLRLKEFMGFLLLATALWLLWLLGRMNGADTMTSALGLYLVLSLALWAWGFATNPVLRRGARRFALLCTVFFLASATGLGIQLRGFFAKQTTPTSTLATEPTASDGFAWLPFTDEALQTALRETTAPIFVDFTADWCWTCKLNEQNILARQDIREAFVKNRVLTFKADFTNFDDEIKAYLDQFNRPGVPMYIFYPSDRNRQPILLPELLTRHHILEGIRQAKAIDATAHQPIRQ